MSEMLMMTDRLMKIFAFCSVFIRGVDIMEVDSPPRVAEMYRKYCLEPGDSLDLKTDGSPATEENNSEHAHRSGHSHHIW